VLSVVELSRGDFFGVDIASIQNIIEDGSRDRGPAFQNDIKQKDQ